MVELAGLEAVIRKFIAISARLLRMRMAGPNTSNHPICAAINLELRPAAYFRPSLIYQLEIRATVRVQDSGHGVTT
jgi:hypothetical protein